jgi:hypothetical protein
MSNKLEEKKLRLFIRKYLVENQKKKLLEHKQTLKEERVLRLAIRKLLQEKESVVPGASTGINELESVLTSIIPAVESDYKKLTSSEDQRKSYRAHIIRAAIDVLLAADAAFAADQEGTQSLSADSIPTAVKQDLPPEATQNLKEQKAEDKIKIKIDDDEEDNIPANDDEKLIDVETNDSPDDKVKTKEEMNTESFSIPGQDLTGRNIALRTWNKRGIGTTIKNGYKLLELPKDRKIFFDYLLTNLKLYFDRFEKDLQGTVAEPTTSTYETIKQNGQSYETSGTTIAEGKVRRKRLVESKKLSDQILSYLLR